MYNEYRNTDELNYFGSDFNKLMNISGSKDMAVMNIDYASVKDDGYNHSYIIVESKHKNEKMSHWQEIFLEDFTLIAEVLQDNPKTKHIDLRVFSVHGNPPWEESIVVKTYSKSKNEPNIFSVSKDKLIKFFSYLIDKL